MRSGAGVKTTAAHHKVVGLNPIREVYTPFLVASHTFLHTISPSFLPREPLVPSAYLLIARTHIHTHTHTHTPTRMHLYFTHWQPFLLYAPLYHNLTGAHTRAGGLPKGLHTLL